MKITFGIITMNEEKNLRRCLTSCAEVADEFVVVDSGSTDGTQVVAREFGAQVVVMEKGRHVDWKNRARQEASHDWCSVLMPTRRSHLLCARRCVY